MPRIDDEPLGPRFEWQLRSALDRIEPGHSTPRYATASRVRSFRVAPVALAAAVAGVLVLSATAVTGTANPRDWPARIATAVQPILEPTSPPEPTPSTEAPKAVTAPVQTAEPHESSRPDPQQSSEPKDSPQPQQTQSPEPRESPEPSHSPEPTPTTASGDH